MKAYNEQYMTSFSELEVRNEILSNVGEVFERLPIQLEEVAENNQAGCNH